MLIGHDLAPDAACAKMPDTRRIESKLNAKGVPSIPESGMLICRI